MDRINTLKGNLKLRQNDNRGLVAGSLALQEKNEFLIREVGQPKAQVAALDSMAKKGKNGEKSRKKRGDWGLLLGSAQRTVDPIFDGIRLTAFMIAPAEAGLCVTESFFDSSNSNTRMRDWRGRVELVD